MKNLSDEATRAVAGIVGAVVFGAVALTELVRFAVEPIPWPGFTAKIAWFITLIGIAIWIPSAVVLALRSRTHRLIAIAGAFFLFSYGVLGTMARSSFAIVYVVLGLLMPVVERLAFGGKLSLGARTEPPRHPSSESPAIL